MFRNLFSGGNHQSSTKCGGCQKEVPVERVYTGRCSRSFAQLKSTSPEETPFLAEAALEKPSSVGGLRSLFEKFFDLSFLHNCSVCNKLFCLNCAPILFGTFAVCESCVKQSQTAEIILQNVEKIDKGVDDQERAAMWLHAGLMLSKGETVAVSFTSAHAPGVPEFHVLTKAGCIARYLELNPTTEHWCDLAEALSWTETASIRITPCIEGQEEKEDLTAADVFTIALNINPKNPMLWTQLGDELPDNGLFVFKRISGPGIAKSRHLVEKCYSKVECFIEAIAIKNDYYDAWASLGIYLAAKKTTAKVRKDIAEERSVWARMPCIGATGESDAAPVISSRVASVAIEKNAVVAPHLLYASEPSAGVAGRSSQRHLVEVDAIECIRRALEYHPGCGVSWTALATLLGRDPKQAPLNSMLVYDSEMHRKPIDGVDSVEASIQAVWSDDSESSWFNLGITLVGREVETRPHHPDFIKKLSDTSPSKKLDSSVVFHEMIKLHRRDPQKFPLASPKIRFALAQDCWSVAEYRSLDARYIIGNWEGANVGSTLTDEHQKRMSRPKQKFNLIANDPTEGSSRYVDVLFPPFGQDYLFWLKIHGGAEGLVLKAVELNSSDATSSARMVTRLLAAKVIPIDPTSVESLLQDFGDLRYLLSDKFSDINIPVRHVRILRDAENGNKPHALVVFMDRAHTTLAKRLDPLENGKRENYIDFSSAVKASRNASPKSLRHRSESVYSNESVESSVSQPTAFHPSAGHLLGEKEVRQYTKSLCSHLSKLHSKFVEHADIKPENLLVMQDGQLLLTDFGLSFKWAADSASDSLQQQQGGGTGCYCPPETAAATIVGARDVWAVGHTVHAMLVGTYNHGTPNEENVSYKLQDVINAVYEKRNAKDFPSLPYVIEFLTMCLQEEPMRRATCVSLLSSNWLKKKQHAVVVSPRN